MDDPKLYAEACLAGNGRKYISQNVFPKVDWPIGDVPEFIVDIGCGDGGFTTNILLPKVPKGSKLLGVDISKTMIDYALKEYGNKYQNLDFKAIDLLGSDDKAKRYSGCFHKVFSFYCFNWIKNQKEAFQQIYEILQPGGAALVTYPINNTIISVQEEVMAMACWKQYINESEVNNGYGYPCNVLKEMLLQIGFQILHCEMPLINDIYEDRRIIKDAMKAVNPFLNQIPIDLHEAFMDDHLKVLDGRNVKSENGYNIKYNQVVAHFKKPFLA